MKLRVNQSIFISTVLIFFSSLACNAAANFKTTPTPTIPPPTNTALPPTATLVPPTATSTPVVVCSEVLSNIFDIVHPNGDVADNLRGEPNDEDNNNFYVLTTYRVNYEKISLESNEPAPEELVKFQEQQDVHQEIWDFYTALFPKEHRSMIGNFTIITDGKNEILAAVRQTNNNPNKWVLEVDIADVANSRELTYTLIHEFAHLLTLNTKQVTPSHDVFDNPGDQQVFAHEALRCDQYFMYTGCSQPKSYLNAFYDEFWVDIYSEWEDTDSSNGEQRYDNLNAFYHKYQDRFVTDYAVVNPVEDIAESFSFFILSPEPTGETISEKKILFFYKFPELVKLRDEIRKQICLLNP